jgi:hypothetical protein
MAQIWAFRCYRSERGVDEIKAWYDRQTPKVRGKFLSRLRTLGQFQAHQWREPYFRWLHGDYEEIGEIRFEVARVQHRPLGFRGAGRVFTLVICAREVNDRFVPGDACATALMRKASIEGNKERSHACWLILE